MSEQKSKLDPEKIAFLAILIFKARLDTEPSFVDAPIKPARHNVDILQEVSLNVEERNVRFRLYLTIKPLDEFGNIIAGIQADYGIDFHYNISNLLEMLYTLENGVYMFHADLAATLFSMSYSTARGIVLERTIGTFMGGVTLPVVDPIKLLAIPADVKS